MSTLLSFRRYPVQSTLWMALAAFWPLVLSAQSPATYTFATPTQPLGDALDQFSRITGYDVAASADRVRGKVAPALRGTWAADAALNRLLAGSNLEFRFSGPKTVAIVPLPPVHAEADPSSATLPEVVVTTRALAPAYSAVDAVSPLKLDVPRLETPQAVSVVPRTLLDDQGIRRLDEALQNVAGVNTGSYFAEWDYYRIRGFEASYGNTYLDGLIAGASVGDELWGLERVEVVKGPASSLYGQGSLGGFVNLISKRPKRDFFGEVEFTGGSFGFYEFALDINSPLNKSGTVQARLNALYRTADSYIDFAGSERIFIAPSFTWEITPDTTFTVLTSFREDWIDVAFALPASGTVLPNPNGRIPITRYIGNPAVGNDEHERIFRIGYELKHRFNDHLSLRHNFRWYRVELGSDDQSYPDYAGSMEDGRTLFLGGYKVRGKFEGLSSDIGLDAVVETGPVKHTFTIGWEYRQTDVIQDAQFSQLVPFDVFDPVYGQFPHYIYGPHDVYKESQHSFGIYAQEHAKFFDKVTLTIGGRYERSVLDGAPDLQSYSIVPRAGLTYEFVPGAVFYANYSQSFTPQFFSVDATGKPVEAETGENIEAGVKTLLWDGRISTQLSVYQLTRQNVATDNVSTPDPFDSIVSGEQRSRGIELEGAIRLARGWDLTMAYTYADTEITQDNVLPVGVRLAGVPQHSFSAWTKYTVQDGPLKGLGVGVGGRYYTEQDGDFSYSVPFQLPAYGVMDAAVYYERGNFRAQVNVENLLDRRYFGSSYDYLYVLPGAPLTVRATVGWTF